MEQDPTVDKKKLYENFGKNYSKTLELKKLDPWNSKDESPNIVTDAVAASKLKSKTAKKNGSPRFLDHMILSANNFDYIGTKAKVDSNLQNL